MTNVERFEQTILEMLETYKKKNHDYGDSFSETMNEFGEVALAIRLNDKLNRYKTLIKSDAKVKSESKEDTLKDLATYAIMGYCKLIENKEKADENQQKTRLKQPKKSGTADALEIGQIRKNICPFGYSVSGSLHKPNALDLSIAKVSNFTTSNGFVYVRWEDCRYMKNDMLVNGGVILSIYPEDKLKDYIGVNATV